MVFSLTSSLQLLRDLNLDIYAPAFEFLDATFHVNASFQFVSKNETWSK